jgi:hypothetical protein
MEAVAKSMQLSGLTSEMPGVVHRARQEVDIPMISHRTAPVQLQTASE